MTTDERPPYRVVSGELVRTPLQHVWPFGTMRVSAEAVELSGLFVKNDRVDRDSCTAVAVCSLLVPLLWCTYLRFELVGGGHHPRLFVVHSARRAVEVLTEYGWTLDDRRTGRRRNK